MPTATVRIVGKPGTYNFDAYATVGGSNTQFATSTFTLGEAVDTPTGNDVTITPLDENGTPSNVDITFEEVSSGGSTARRTYKHPLAVGRVDVIPVIRWAHGSLGAYEPLYRGAPRGGGGSRTF